MNETHNYDGIRITIGQDNSKQRIDIPHEVVAWLGKDKKVIIRAKEENFPLDYHSEICGIRMGLWMAERENKGFPRLELVLEQIRIGRDTEHHHQSRKGHAQSQDQQDMHDRQTSQHRRDPQPHQNRQQHQEQNRYEEQQKHSQEQPNHKNRQYDQDNPYTENQQRDQEKATDYDQPQHQAEEWDEGVQFMEDEILFATVEMAENRHAFVHHSHPALLKAVLESVPDSTAGSLQSASLSPAPPETLPDGFPPDVPDFADRELGAESHHASDVTFCPIHGDHSDPDMSGMPGAFPDSFSDDGNDVDDNAVPGAYPASIAEDGHTLFFGSDPGSGTCTCS